jgi:phage terminase large subunit GpA-like protein
VAKRRFCWAVKGQSGAGIPLIQDRIKRLQRLRKRKQQTVTPEPLGVDQGKAIIMSRLQLTEVGAGYCHFPNEVEFDEEYFAQLTAEKLVTRYQRGRPRQEWVQTRPRNEAIDIRVYGLACRRLIGTKEPEPEPERTPTPKRVNKQFGGGAWL